MAKLPKEIFVKWGDGGNGPPYLLVEPKLYDIAEQGAKIKVGRYRLVEVSEVECMVQQRKLPPSKNR